MTANEKNFDPSSEEMTEVLDGLIAAAKNIADVLMCAYRTIQREMLERGAPQELADDAALLHTRRFLDQMMNPGGATNE